MKKINDKLQMKEISRYDGLCKDNGDTCEFLRINIAGTIYARDTNHYDDTSGKCHDCEIVNKKGNVHHYGCDIETCPVCGNQLTSCDCEVKQLISEDGIINVINDLTELDLRN